MEILTVIEQTTDALKTYKGVVDAEEQEIKKQEQTYKNIVDNKANSGKYAPGYIEELRKGFKPDHDVKARIEQARKQVNLDDFINNMQYLANEIITAPIRGDFATKINTYYQMGLPVSDAELDTLKQGCNFSELQLLAHLGKNRTVEELKTSIDETGTPRTEKATRANPYIIDVPDAQELKNEILQFIASAKHFINNYCGCDGALSSYTGTPYMLVGGADSYFRNGADAKIKDFLSKIAPCIQERTTPTPNERKLYEIALAQCINDYSKEKLHEKIKSNPEIAKLFNL